MTGTQKAFMVLKDGLPHDIKLLDGSGFSRDSAREARRLRNYGIVINTVKIIYSPDTKPVGHYCMALSTVTADIVRKIFHLEDAWINSDSWERMLDTAEGSNGYEQAAAK